MAPPPSAANEPAAGASAPLDLLARARRVGQWAWIERRVFELFGGWAASTPDPAAAVLFGEMSRRHGWHAEVFFDRLPELASVDAEALVVPPGPSTEALLGALAAEQPDTVAVARLVGAYRVLLPLLVTEYTAAAATLSTVAEPSLCRWVRIVLRDDVEEWSRGQGLLLDVLVDDDAVHAAAARQVELDLLVVSSARLNA